MVASALKSCLKQSWENCQLSIWFLISFTVKKAKHLQSIVDEKEEPPCLLYMTRGCSRCMGLVQTHKCSLLIMGPHIFQIKLYVLTKFIMVRHLNQTTTLTILFPLYIYIYLQCKYIFVLSCLLFVALNGRPYPMIRRAFECCARSHWPYIPEVSRSVWSC